MRANKQLNRARDTLHPRPHPQRKIRDQVVRPKQLRLAGGEGEAEGQLLAMGEAESLNDSVI